MEAEQAFPKKLPFELVAPSASASLSQKKLKKGQKPAGWERSLLLDRVSIQSPSSSFDSGGNTRGPVSQGQLFRHG